MSGQPKKGKRGGGMWKGGRTGQGWLAMNRMTQPHHAHESLDGHNNIQTYTCTLIQISLLPQEGVGLLPSCLPLNSQDSSSAPIVKAKPWLEEEGGICWERKGRGNTGNRISSFCNWIAKIHNVVKLSVQVGLMCPELSKVLNAKLKKI